MPQRGSIRVMGSPRRATWPAVGWRKPAKRESMVDLPQPEAPSRQTNSPSSTSSERSRTATSSVPAPVSKDLVTWRADRMGSGNAAALPGQEGPFEAQREPVGDEDGERDAEHADEDERQVAPVLRLPDQGAQAVLRGDHLGG